VHRQLCLTHFVDPPWIAEKQVGADAGRKAQQEGS
jgi:hypothetical protein